MFVSCLTHTNTHAEDDDEEVKVVPKTPTPQSRTVGIKFNESYTKTQPSTDTLPSPFSQPIVYKVETGGTVSQPSASPSAPSSAVEALFAAAVGTAVAPGSFMAPTSRAISFLNSLAGDEEFYNKFNALHNNRASSKQVSAAIDRLKLERAARTTAAEAMGAK